MADDDPKLERVRDAMIDNFMAAILHGKLVVEGHASGNNWTLDAETLEGFVRKRPEAHAFYEALQDPAPAEKTIPRVGNVRLYININDKLEKKLHTITMRRPLMKIDTFKHNSISAKYAAVLVCDSKEGNKYLRNLEPPQHHEWDPARDPVAGKSVINLLKTFTRDSLRERIRTEIGDEVAIEGLARFLPTDLPTAVDQGKPTVPDAMGESTEIESSTVVGAGATQRPEIKAPAKKVRVKVQRPATGQGDSLIIKGKDRGGKHKRAGIDAGLPGEGEAGDGSSRISGQDLLFRSWCTADSNEEGSLIALALTARKDEMGDIRLVGLGPGGEPEHAYLLPITRAVLHESGATREIECSANTLRKVQLKGGQLTRIDVYMPPGLRYRLGVV